MTTYLNISALSRRTGVAPDTLRKWERRYGVLSPERTAGSQRRYTEQDVARVVWLRDRLAEGWRIGEAARVLREQAAPAITDPAELRRALAEAAQGATPAAVDGLLDQAFAVLPTEQLFAEVLAPVLVDVGESWHAGGIDIADEHAFTGRVRSKLEQLLADDRPAVRGVAVLACAPREQHEIGLMMLAVLLRADGWRVEYLGAATPVADALAYAKRVGAALVCFSASQERTAATLEKELRKRLPGVEAAVAVGGAAVDRRLGRSLGALYANGDPNAVVEALRKAGGDGS